MIELYMMLSAITIFVSAYSYWMGLEAIEEIEGMGYWHDYTTGQKIMVVFINAFVMPSWNIGHQMAYSLAGIFPNGYYIYCPFPKGV